MRLHTKDNVTNWNYLSTTKCDDLGRDIKSVNIENTYMAKKKIPSAYEKEVIHRTRSLRNARKAIDDRYNQEYVARNLGITREAYAKYETDRIMDNEHMERFCEMFRCSIDYLLTGKEHPLVAAYSALPHNSAKKTAVNEFLGIIDDGVQKKRNGSDGGVSNS